MLTQILDHLQDPMQRIKTFLLLFFGFIDFLQFYLLAQKYFQSIFKDGYLYIYLPKNIPYERNRTL